MDAIVFDLPSCIARDVFQLRCLAFETGNTAALNAVVRSFVAGAFTHVIKTCHEAFEAGTDIDDEMVNMMRHVFEARLGLSLSLHACPDDDRLGRMLGDLHYADENLREFTSAVLIIDDESYDNAVEDSDWWPVEGEEWFCARHRLEQRVPRGLVEALLTQLAEARD
jgi:hypothetical protein